MANRFDINTMVGVKYNRLTVVSEVEPWITKGGNKKRMISCVCDCGKVKNYSFSDVKNGIIFSCGCYSASLASDRAKIRNKKHGMYNLPEYNVWISMRKRCNNKTHKSYKHYGYRGIYVCESWNKSFVNFINDMGQRPSSKHTIERIDNNKGYCKENCKWATRKEQCNNQSQNVRIEYCGKIKTVAQWAEILGFSWNKLYYRAFISNMSLNKAFDNLKI